MAHFIKSFAPKPNSYSAELISQFHFRNSEIRCGTYLISNSRTEMFSHPLLHDLSFNRMATIAVCRCSAKVIKYGPRIQININCIQMICWGVWVPMLGCTTRQASLAPVVLSQRLAFSINYYYKYFIRFYKSVSNKMDIIKCKDLNIVFLFVFV